jgi:hypothetical protein
MNNKRKATPVYVYTTQEGSWELKPQQPYRFELDSLDSKADLGNADMYLGNADKYGF